MVSQELLQELHTIIKEDYDIDLPPDAVFEVANTLVGFYDLFAKIDAEELNK